MEYPNNKGYGKPYNHDRGNRGGNEVQTKKFEPLNKLTYVKDAENIISAFPKRGSITTNQIRIILDLINEVYIPLKSSASTELSDDMLSKLQYVKMKIAYQAGRENKVKLFVNNTNLMNYIDDVKTKDDMILLAHYVEALVAYHKYYNIG